MTIDLMLIERLYEAALTPAALPRALQEVADLVGSKGMIVNFVGEQVSFLPSPGVERLIDDYVTGGFTGNEARIEWLHREQPPCFVPESSIRTPEELYALPIYRDFLLPRGFLGAVATPIQGVADIAVHIAAEGFPSLAAAEQAVTTLDALRPHLARVLSLACKMATVRAEAIVDGLAAAGIAAAVVHPDRRLAIANSAFQQRFGNRMFEGRAGLRFEEATLDARFRTALAGLKGGRSAQSVPVPAPEHAPACAIHLLPITGVSRDLLGSDGVLMIVAEAANASVPAADLLRLLFDLTPAEARLTRHLLEGRTPAEAAAALTITEATARTHLRRIFAKTGVARQADLVRLLLGLGGPSA